MVASPKITTNESFSTLEHYLRIKTLKQADFEFVALFAVSPQGIVRFAHENYASYNVSSTTFKSSRTPSWSIACSLK